MLIHLVDDEASVRDVLARILARAGYTVVCTGTGADAIALLDRQLADLVLLDVMLPDTDGVQLCAYLKRNPATASVPIVLLTGHDPLELQASAQAAGASAVLGKPF
jgi:CheY-like chemotaxis protein